MHVNARAFDKALLSSELNCQYCVIWSLNAENIYPKLNEIPDDLMSQSYLCLIDLKKNLLHPSMCICVKQWLRFGAFVLHFSDLNIYSEDKTAISLR